MEKFQNRLKLLREERSMSMNELAKELNSSKSTISRYESGAREPKLAFLQTVARYFNVSIEYVSGETDIREEYKDDHADLINKFCNLTEGQQKIILNKIDELIKSIIKEVIYSKKKKCKKGSDEDYFELEITLNI